MFNNACRIKSDQNPLDPSTKTAGITCPNAFPIGINSEPNVLAKFLSLTGNQFAASRVDMLEKNGCDTPFRNCPTNTHG
jgi:hypothetical protein